MAFIMTFSYINTIHIYQTHPPLPSPVPSCSIDHLPFPILILSCLFFSFDDPVGSLGLLIWCWVRDYLQDHGLLTSDYTTEENVSPSCSDHKLAIIHRDEASCAPPC